MTKEQLTEFLKERGATPAQIETIEQGMLNDWKEIAQKHSLVPGEAWYEQKMASTRAKFVATVKWNEGKDKGISAKDLEELLG